MIATPVPLQIRIYDKHILVFSEEIDGAVELGRQSESQEGLYSKWREADCWRVVIARFDEDAISRKHALLEPLPENRVRLTNTSSMVPIRVMGLGELPPKASSEVALPALLTIGRKTIRVEPVGTEDLPIRGLAEATVAPGQFALKPRLPTLELPATSIEVESLVRSLESVIGVLQTAASSSDFFQRAAQAVVEIIGLDSGRVLILDHEDWKTEAIGTATDTGSESVWGASRHVLSRLRSERRTFWQDPEQAGIELESASLMGVSSVVAAPILNREGAVIGALYGEKRLGGRSASVTGIRKLDAMLMELLASGVAAGLARMEQEKAALAARVQFEQFFTPELARELSARPDLLKGRNVEVTLLFCDIRGFSRISERLGPAGTVEWLGDVMGALSDCVLAHQGVLVDYIGDELIAMWGAPKETPEHARLACRAALDMLDRLPELNRRWQEALQAPFWYGIGINTGVAQVGNTGSNRKFKYGALGNTVNLASRVEGVTKYLKTKLIVTGSTRAQLDASFLTRRLCKAAVVNIAEPVDLYELAAPTPTDWTAFQRAYEQALTAFEQKEFHDSARLTSNLLADHPDDGPSLILLSRAVNCLVEEPADFDPVWKLPGK